MEHQESIFTRNVKVVGIAGVAAGVFGGLAGRFLSGRREPTRQERVQMALADLTRGDVDAIKTTLVTELSKARDRLSEVTESVQTEADKAREEASRDARKLAQTAREDVKSAAETGTSLSEQLRSALREGAVRFGESLRETVDQTAKSVSAQAAEMSHTTSRLSEQQREQFEKRAEEARDSLEARTTEGREDLVKLGKSAKHNTEERLQEIEKLAREMVERRVKPTIEKAAATAASGAEEAREWLAEEGRELEKRYEDVKPALEETASEYADRALEFRQAAEERAQEAEESLREGSAHAREVAHEASVSARKGGRDIGSLVFWLSVAGGLVYLVLLSDEQKRTARELAKSAWHEGTGIYQDIRGENADFTQA